MPLVDMLQKSQNNVEMPITAELLETILFDRMLKFQKDDKTKDWWSFGPKNLASVLISIELDLMEQGFLKTQSYERRQRGLQLIENHYYEFWTEREPNLNSGFDHNIHHWFWLPKEKLKFFITNILVPLF